MKLCIGKSSHITILLVLTVFIAVSCKDAETDNSGADDLVYTYYSRLWDEDLDSIDLAKVDSLTVYYSKKENDRLLGICYLIKGEVLYDRLDYTDAMLYLKKAEQYIEPTDSAATILYKSLAEILYALNPAESSVYVDKLYQRATAVEDTVAKIEANITTISLTDDYGKACAVRRENMQLCAAVGDTLAMLRTNAKFAFFFADSLSTDSVVELLLPYYDTTGDAYEAEILASVYLAAELPEKARPYIERMASEPDMTIYYLTDKATYYRMLDSCCNALDLFYQSYIYFVSQYNEAYDENISMINAWHNRTEAEEQLLLRKKRNLLTVVALVTGGVLLIGVCVALLLYYYHHDRKTQLALLETARREITEREAKLQENRKFMILSDLHDKQRTKLLAISDVCKSTLSKAIVSQPGLSEEIATFLKKRLSDIYPKLTDTDYQYMFMMYIGLPKKEVADLLGVDTKSINWRLSMIRKKLDLPQRTKLNSILDGVFVEEVSS